MAGSDEDSGSKAGIDGLRAAQDEAIRETMQERLCLVQGWIDEFALILKKWRPPKVFLGNYLTIYKFITHRIYINVITLLTVDEELLRIVIAHECAHSTRHWRLLGSWVVFNLDRFREDVIADRMAMQLTGCDVEELITAMRVAMSIEYMDDDFPGATIERLLSWRRAMLICPESEFEELLKQCKKMSLKLQNGVYTLMDSHDNSSRNDLIGKRVLDAEEQPD